jgi:hypothetical protein
MNWLRVHTLPRPGVNQGLSFGDHLPSHLKLRQWQQENRSHNSSTASRADAFAPGSAKDAPVIEASDR